MHLRYSFIPKGYRVIAKGERGTGYAHDSKAILASKMHRLCVFYTPLPLYPYTPIPLYPEGVILSSISEGEGVIAEGEGVILSSISFAFRRRKAKLRSPLYPYAPLVHGVRGDLSFDFRRRRGDRLRRKAQESKAKKG